MAPAMCLGNTNRPLTTAAWEPGTAATVLGVTLVPFFLFSALAFLCGHQLLATDLGPLTIL